MVKNKKNTIRNTLKNNKENIISSTVKNSYSTLSKYFRNNYQLLKSIFSFLIAIGLVIVLYSVYKHYKNSYVKEGFLDQEPYDLLDKIKTNIYLINPIWDNRLYNEQPEINESPLSFWSVLPQDSNYKLLGHAVSNDFNEFKNNMPIAPKDKTLLIDGDTKKPKGQKLIYRTRDNMVSKKINLDNNLVNNEIYRNLFTINDIDNRILKIKEFYDVIGENQKALIDTLNIRRKELEDIKFIGKVYTKGQYFDNNDSTIPVSLSRDIAIGNNNYNGVSIPLGFDTELTFSNGVKYKFKTKISNMVDPDANGLMFKKLTYDMIFNADNDLNIFNKDNFNIFGRFGLNMSATGGLLASNQARVHNYRGRRERNMYVEFASNFVVADNKNSALSSYGKKNIYNYVNKLRNNLIKTDGTNDDYQTGSSNRKHNDYFNDTSGKLYYSRTTDDDNNAMYLFSSEMKRPSSSSKQVIPIFDIKNGGGSRKKSLTLKKDTLNINDEEDANNSGDVCEGFETDKVNGTYNAANGEIKMPNVEVVPDFFSGDISILKLVNDIIRMVDTLKSDTTVNYGFENLIDELGDDNLNNYFSSLTSNAKCENLYRPLYYNSKTKLVTYNMPWYFIHFYMQHPVFNVQGSMHNGGKASFKKSAYFSPRKATRNGTVISYKDVFHEFKDCHNIGAIKGQSIKGIKYTFNNKEKEHIPGFKLLSIIEDKFTNILDNLSNKCTDYIKSLNILRDQVLANGYNHYPMKIYRPIPPNNYKSLGDLIFAQTSTFNDDKNYYADEPNLSEYACVPKQCVSEVREWLPIDKIYEYQKDTEYLAIFKNPYLQTFRAVTTPGTLPPGKVEKVVACVERCRLVDDIIQADKCAKAFYKSHKSITESINMDPDNVINERKNQIYKNKIMERQNRINNLKESARQLQVQDDKANLVNEAYNRNKLQNLVDKQYSNMHKLVDNLQKGKNTIAINVKFNYDKLFSLCSNGNLPNEVCSFVQENIRKPSDTLTDEERKEYDTKALTALLDSCPTPESEGLVKRALVENNCGCYFTDEEIEANF
jgi:hypothetical protein